MERGLLSGNNGQILRDCKVESVTKVPSVTEIIARDNNKDTTINNAPYWSKEQSVVDPDATLCLQVRKSIWRTDWFAPGRVEK